MTTTKGSSMPLHPMVATYAVTCHAVPFQIEGTLVDGRYFYFRDRHGYASLGVGVDHGAAVDHSFTSGWGVETEDEFAYDLAVVRGLLDQVGSCAKGSFVPPQASDG
jgi:hypothetical protein